MKKCNIKTRVIFNDRWRFAEDHVKKFVVKAPLDECLGYRTCGLCEAFIPGFWSRDGGITVVDDYEQARAAIDSCPQGCVIVNAVRGE